MSATPQLTARLLGTLAALPALTMAAPSGQSSPDRISLAGEWQFAFDAAVVGESEGWAKRTLADRIVLPTTTSVARKGRAQGRTQEAYHLTEVHPYVGVAWYRRNFAVPKTWAGRSVRLSLERTKSVRVWLDGTLVGESNALSAAQTYDLGALASGNHALALEVDNRLERWPDRVSASHMLETSTQANWNGVLGRIELTVGGTLLTGVSTAPGTTPQTLRVRPILQGAEPGTLTVRAFDRGRKVAEATTTGGEATLDFGTGAKLWDEFHPHLYRVEAVFQTATGRSTWSGEVGLRDFRAAGGSFLINGRRTFLRGKHDACVFPLTGHPPIDVAGWTRYLRICQEYGINHVRFHSWCPPEAAFVAADRLGVYLQPELPFWGDPAKPGVEPFLLSEGVSILRAYGHHPSFVMLSLGNEFWGEVPPRPRLVAALRAVDPSRLYAQGSNSESWNPREFPGDDYRTSAYIALEEVGEGRGSYAHADKRLGYIPRGTAGTSHTYDAPLVDSTLPFVSHEIGQYQVFPNFREIPKYTGALRADNFATFRERLAKAGMADQAEAFFRASGELAALCYREEIEATLRTNAMDGFQLLDLQDYPGQGTALVGMLDAFMDSKGLIGSREWRAFCSELVPLALFPRHTWRTDERLTAEVRVANYGETDARGPVQWSLTQGDRRLARGEFRPGRLPTGGVTNVGTISAPLSEVRAPGKITLTLQVGKKSLAWPLWVYGKLSNAVPSGVVVTRKLDAETLGRLDRGESVLLLPKAEDLPNSLPGFFTPDFWNYPMFKAGNPPGTLGFLIADRHPALAGFPTASHSEWQWQSLAHTSRAVVLDGLPGVRPIVQTIDNFSRNHRLGTLFEMRVGRGRLLVCTVDLLGLEGVPEADALRRSLLDYVGSPRFTPTVTVAPETVRKALHG